MEKPATKDDLQQAVSDLGRHFNTALNNHAKRMDERFDHVDRRLDAIATDVSLIKRALLDLAADTHLRNLVRQLQAKGIELDESKIFVA